MPQVQVALRSLEAGKTVRVNDVISYITVLPADDSNPDINSSMPAPKRAYSPMDVIKSAGALKPDVDWYLSKQIFPPIERLCAPIPGTDAGRLAECLGLDPRKFATFLPRGEASNNAFDITPLDSQQPDAIRYKACPRLNLTCNKCKNSFVFEGLANPVSSTYMTSRSIHCPSSDCNAEFRALTLVAQVEAQIRKLTNTYYETWLVCDEQTCGNRTRSMSVYGQRCLGPNGLAKGCLGHMSLEVSGKHIGNTLSYWRGLWDVEKKATMADKPEEVERIRALRSAEIRERFATVKAVVEAYEKKCGWIWVQMDGLFGFALKG
jgi:DNA polymerase alpha subunit A